ncbi:AMP-dependent synthetase/ligase [Actinokineospora iranica]|uniref:Long-chain acyl-CoA synthetase n=1 Tax=Actinokineospora iranica TaxID=1271860 RepID=A0A1G6U0X9_9PSEU|nr:AMP-dependent synthetase/ligase [Actinokineospora iranica]SDD34267.1 long-chain acyl-CoA synthetase [Actinokineospora iranica]
MNIPTFSGTTNSDISLLSTSFSGSGVELPSDAGLFFVLGEGVEKYPGRPALSRKNGAEWQDIGYPEFTEHVLAVASVLLGHGVASGDRVAVFGRTAYEWAVADFAALAIGAVTVPIYPTASDAQIRHVLDDSGARVCFAETAEFADRLTAAGASRVWLFAEVEGMRAQVAHPDLDARVAAVRADDLATIVYTSGTTGLPKGCILTHRNMYASSANTVEQTDWLFRTAVEGSDEQAATLLCLPLSHVFGRTILLSCLVAGTRTGLVAGVPEMLPELPVFRPTFLALVPYALEKIRKRARALVDPAAEETAIELGLAVARGVPVEPALSEAHAALDATVFQRVRDSFGGRFRYVISGGASLDDSTAGFYAGMGVRILNCYGLTEAATAVTVNETVSNRLGSVGRPIPGTTIAIAEDGELLVRGPNVSPGYWPDPSSDGPWLRTGDLGAIDEDGFLYITGRRKELLVTSGGKNVAPTPLEDRVRLHPLVSNCMVIGDNRSYVTALITLDEPALRQWAAEHGLSFDDPAWREDPRLLAEVQVAVDDANGLVSRAESIRRFRLLPVDFTVADGHLTPSMKLRRAAIEAAFAEDVAALY